MNAKPAIVVYGNCAGQLVARALRGVADLNAAFDIHWVRSFTDQSLGDEPFDTGILARCAVFLEQVGTFRDDLQRKGAGLHDVPLPAACRRIRFPPLFMNTLWPFAAPDPRSEAQKRPWHVEGPYPAAVCNRLILEIMREERDPERVFQRFMATPIRQKVDLDRLHHLMLAKMKALDCDSDIRFAEFVSANFATKRLFRAQLHPTGTMIRHLCSEVFRCLEIAPHLTEAILAEFEMSRGIGGYDAPIHPEIVAHFGLTWVNGLSYRHFAEGYFTHDEFIRRYIRLEWTPHYYLGLHLFANNQLLEAESLLTLATQRPGATSTYFRRLAQIREGLGWTEQAHAAQQAATSAPPGD
jgi:hypothetical protein